MSLAPDPADKKATEEALDAKADGAFGGVAVPPSHRAGYAPDKLANARYMASKGGSLQTGLGLILEMRIRELEATVAELREDVANLTSELHSTQVERDARRE